MKPTTRVLSILVAGGALLTASCRSCEPEHRRSPGPETAAPGEAAPEETGPEEAPPGEVEQQPAAPASVE